MITVPFPVKTLLFEAFKAEMVKSSKDNTEQMFSEQNIKLLKGLITNV